MLSYIKRAKKMPPKAGKALAATYISEEGTCSGLFIFNKIRRILLALHHKLNSM